MSSEASLRIDLASDVPATRQIVDNLRVLLVEGRIQPGTELPSVRRTAMELGIHFNTVAEAYRTLAAEGWLELKHGRGATVLDRTRPKPDKARMPDWRHRLKQVAAQMMADGHSRTEVAQQFEDIAKELSQ